MISLGNIPVDLYTIKKMNFLYDEVLFDNMSVGIIPRIPPTFRSQFIDLLNGIFLNGAMYVLARINTRDFKGEKDGD